MDKENESLAERVGILEAEMDALLEWLSEEDTDEETVTEKPPSSEGKPAEETVTEKPPSSEGKPAEEKVTEETVTEKEDRKESEKNGKIKKRGGLLW